MAWICELSSRASLVVTETAMTGRETPQARPRLRWVSAQPFTTSSRHSRSLGRDKAVGDVLVLAQEGEVEDNLDGLDVGGHDDELGDTTVERLGGLVGTLLELLVVRGLLDDVEDLGWGSAPSRETGKLHTWFVSCALASGKALALTSDILLLMLMLVVVVVVVMVTSRLGSRVVY